MLSHPGVLATAERLGARRPRSRWPGCSTCRRNVLLIPGTSSLGHLEENLAAADVELDAEAMDLLSGAEASGGSGASPTSAHTD